MAERLSVAAPPFYALLAARRRECLGLDDSAFLSVSMREDLMCKEVDRGEEMGKNCKLRQFYG